MPGELTLSDAEYRDLQALLKGRTGIDLADNKRALVVSRLHRRLVELGCDSFRSYLERVHVDLDEGRFFVSALTTNVTEFFREAYHFEALKQLAPELTKGRSELVVWSSACSTGEEPWSIAMTLGSLQLSVPFRVLATDIDDQVLAVAKKGEYPFERVKHIPSVYLQKNLERNQAHTFVRVRDELRRYVSFGQLNLLENWPLRTSFDVIFCRNVLIYFDGPTRAKLVARFANQLRVGGYLMLGHSEALLGSMPLLEPCGKTMFRRVAHGSAS